MLTYESGGGVARRVDPRTKLALQAGFAVAAFAATTPSGLAVLTGGVAMALAAGRVGPLEAVLEFGPFVPFLLGAPILAGLSLSSPWFVWEDAISPLLASYRNVLLLVLGAVYVKTTPVRESQAAVRWFLPGRVGRGAALGVGFVFRLLPAVQADLSQIRTAMRARAGQNRALTDRMRIVATEGLHRAIDRSDSLSTALRARCLSWNATTPPLAAGPVDYGLVAVALGLLGSPLVL
ncbi:MAG: energy-coupling factor transporter transmembrane protein EcfT [Halanaeroarchaeum sp.]